VGAVAPASRRAVHAGAWVAVVVIAAALAVEVVVARHTFHDRANTHGLALSRVPAFLSGSQRLPATSRVPADAADAVPPTRHVRAWRTATRTPATLSLEVSGLDGAARLRWGLAASVTGRVRWQEPSLVVPREGESVVLSLDGVDLPAPGVLALVLEVPAGEVVEVRSVWLADAAGRRLPAIAALARPRLWYGGPNLVGHVLAATAVMGAATAGRVRGAGALLALGGAAIAMTGSRTALVAALLGGAWVLASFLPQRRRRWVALGVVVLAALAVGPVAGWLGRAGVWRLDDRNVVWRLGQMQDAWETMLAAPWTGGPLAESAHNFWLQLGGSYGLPGLIAAAWFTLGILWLARRWAGARGLGMAVAVLVLQIADDSLAYLGVSGPLALALAALAADRTGDVAAPSALAPPAVPTPGPRGDVIA